MKVRRLVACDDCHRQYEAAELKTGDKFRCVCGQTVTLLETRAHDAGVVRCSACGGTRREGAKSCSFCGSNFTIHEQDLGTVCPECFARISNHASFCHSCGTEIKATADAGTAGERSCPACEDEPPLYDRRIGEKKVPILECHLCAGFWLDDSDFKALAREAAQNSLPPELAGPGGAPTPFTLPKKGERLYRRCPFCEDWMLRKNVGSSSGIIIDLCTSHGIWFDEGELAGMLRWYRQGGVEAALRKREAEVKRKNEGPSFHQKSIDRMARSGTPARMGDGIGGDILGDAALDGLFRVFDTLFDKFSD